MTPDILPPVPVPQAQTQPSEHCSSAERLLSAFLRGRNARTLRAYRQDLTDFAVFASSRSLAEAAHRLLAHDHGAANELALGYRAYLVERGLAGATINRRLAALRSLV